MLVDVLRITFELKSKLSQNGGVQSARPMKKATNSPGVAFLLLNAQMAKNIIEQAETISDPRHIQTAVNGANNCFAARKINAVKNGPRADAYR